MTTWLTSDLHLGHENIIRYCDRPFDDVHHMDAELVRRWRDRVMPDDDVWVLGDVAMGRIDDSLAKVAQLPGTKHLVAGNHDRCWPGHGPGHQRWIERYRDAGFVDIVMRAEIDLGHGVVLPACHFPYAGDSQDHERYREHRPVDDGRWLLHGHVHEKWWVEHRQINVGVDVWDYAPVDAATLRGLVVEAGAAPGAAGGQVVTVTGP